jgi:hypothetical protein
VDGRLKRITGEALIHSLTDPMYEFHGRCYRTINQADRHEKAVIGRMNSMDAHADTTDETIVIPGDGLLCAVDAVLALERWPTQKLKCRRRPPPGVRSGKRPGLYA